jgi:hypothetical protein
MRQRYTRRWREATSDFLSRPGNETCSYCPAPATLVDHRVAHKGDLALFWSESNWCPCCDACNRSKAAASEGGMGNARREWKGRRVLPGCDENGMPLDPLHPWNNAPEASAAEVAPNKPARTGPLRAARNSADGYWRKGGWNGA